MREVAIVGAGELGGILAYDVARANLVTSVRLIDEAGRAAEGQALDITQAAPIEGFATKLSGESDLMTAAGASIVVIADRWRSAEWTGEQALLLIKRLKTLAPRALVVCAGAGQRELVDRGVAEAHVARSRILGSAPDALRSAVRALVALECNTSPSEIALSVLGVPPGRTVVAWETATVGGFPLSRVLDEPSRRRLNARVAALWPPGPRALAAAATAVVQRLLGASRGIACCFVAPEGAGARTRTAALPVRLGPNGVEEVIVPRLSAAEQTALDSAMLL